jgi:hypothetical protein
MAGKRGWIKILLAIVGLAGGAALGLWYGWMVAPVEWTDTDLAHLHPFYKDEFVLMVSKAYALDGDLDTARARMALLDLPDPAAAVADLAERYIAQSAPTPQIRALAQLADAMGAGREAFQPYLHAEDAP